jgi:lipopolysaccharide export system permease protein
LKLLDRYIIRQFLINFSILLVVLMTLFILVDLIIDFDEFLEAGQVHQDRWQGSPLLATIAITLGYYGPVVLLIYTFFNGLIVLAAMGFTLTGLLRNRELIAVVASGVSLYRVAAPIIVAGLLLILLALPVQEFVLPGMSAALTRSKSQLSRETYGMERRRLYYANAGDRDLLSAARFTVDGGNAKLHDVRIVQRDPDKMTYQLVTAQGAEWNKEQQRWRLIGVTAEQPPNPGDGRARGQRVTDAQAWYDADLTPKVLLARRDERVANLLSIRDLQGMLGNEALRPGQSVKLQQIIWSRFSLIVLNVLVLIIGLPFFLRRLPVNMLQPALRAAALCLGAWGAGLLLLQLPPGGLPIVIAWLPVVLFLPVAAWALMSIRT